MFMMRTGPVDSATEEEDLVPELRFNALFGESLTWKKFASLLSQGSEIRATPLTEQYDLDDYRARMGKETLPLFAIDPEGDLHFVNNRKVPEPGPGWTLASLVPAEVLGELQRERQKDNGDQSAPTESDEGLPQPG
jgi:hypothetical protein